MPSYFIEVLDNLSVVDIYIEVEKDKGNGSGHARLAGNQLVYIDKEATVSLPVPVDQDRATISALSSSAPGYQKCSDSRDWVRIRAPIASNIKKSRLQGSSQLITDVSRPITAKVIDGLRDISCRNCNEALLQTAANEAKHPLDLLNVRDLPSTYWSELIDCWVCHPEEDELSVNMDLLHAFEPEDGTRRSAASSSRVNATINPDTRCPQASSSKLDIWVGNTHVLAPEALFRALPTQRVVLDAKMPNFLLKDPRPSVSVDLSQALASELVDHAAAHAIYKFIVEDRKSCKPMALVHLVGWNAEVVAHEAASSNKPVSGKCIKVMYMSAESSSFALTTK
ncbi:hypothetical protein GGI12_004118, partial [Dipsacomyces acuminosporus]